MNEESLAEYTERVIPSSWKNPGPPSLRLLVNATVWTWEVSGADYAAALRRELSMLQDDPAVRWLLEAPAGNDELGRAVQVARSVLGGNPTTVAV